MASRDSIPLSICIIASVAIHAMVLLPSLGGALTGQPGAEPAGLDEPEPEQASSTPEPEQPERPNPLIRRPIEMERVQLGIDNGSEQPLTTWIGYEEYQEHLARLSEVEQAAMRMTDAGGGEPSAAPPGAMSLASPTAPPSPSDAPPSPITEPERAHDVGQLADGRPVAPAIDPTRTPNAPPSPMSARASADATRQPPTAPVPQPVPPITPLRPAPPDAPPTEPKPPSPAPEPVAPAPAATAPPAPAPGLTLPRPAELPRSTDGAPLPPEPPADTAPAPDPIVRPLDGAGKDEAPEPQPEPIAEPLPQPPAPPTPNTEPKPPPPDSAVAPTIAPIKPIADPSTPTPSEPAAPFPEDLEVAPPHQNPERAAPPSPPTRPEGAPESGETPGQPSRPSATPGPPVSGDLSDREADPTSTIDVPSDRWRNGRPLAARGLRIETRRPALLPEYLAVQTGPGRHPTYELQFDRRGTVRKVTLLESSGVPQLDERLTDCLYRWRASGERLSSLKDKEFLKLSMRILVR